MADSTHPVDFHVGRRLRERRMAQSITQADLGGDLGISAQQVQKYENGQNRISASKLFEVARRLGTTVSWFFEGLDDSPAAGFVEAAAPFDPAPSQHSQTRELIAAFRALPSDAARSEVLARLKANSADII